MPTNVKQNENQKTYDKDVARFAKRIAVAYGNDKVRLLASRDVRRAVLLHDIDAINRVIAKVPQMSAGLRLDFCDAFIGEDMAGLDLATPAILGDAYRAISARVKEGDAKQQERLDKIAARIDDLSADFANSGGMVVSQNEWPLVDMSNIATINEGFSNMLEARMVDVTGAKKDEIEANNDYAKKVAKDYDGANGLSNVRAEDAPKLADRWDEIYAVLNRAKIFDETKAKAAKCKFLDGKNQVMPQFSSGKRGDDKKYEEYADGFDIAKGSRLDSVVELARHNVAKRHVADFETKIDENALEAELNTEILTVLYEIYAADRVVQDATNTPEQFADPVFRNEFMAALEEMGEEISNNGYNIAIETQTDATVGWATRLRSKVGTMGKKLNTLWTRVNRPLERIDDMADVRMPRGAVVRRKKRREFCWHILRGFDSAFIVSGIITVIAAAAAARLGVSLATGLAMVGGGLAVGMIGFQVARWIKNQKKNNLPVSLEEFFKDKQLVRSIATSALAIFAMGLGAGGLGAAAMTVGVGAALLGAYNNGRGVFEAALDTKMSRRQAVAWAIANAGSVIAGALGGGYVGRGLVSMFNRLYPGNTFFQNKETVAGEQRKVSDEVTHEKTTMHYTDKMLQSAKDAVEQWYAQDNPGHPEILQQDIDAVNQYNLDHDTNLDPYRILRAMKISQPSRLAYTPAWSDTYHVPQELISQAAHAVGGGVYDPAGMEAAKFLDANYLGASGNVGDVPMGHTINRTYSPITELPTETTETVIDQPAVYEQTYNDTYKPVDVKPGYGAFGNYTPRERIHDRIGSFLDRVRRNRQNGSVSEDVPPVIRNDEPKDEVPPIVLDERDEELRITGENTPSPVRRKEYVPPVVNLSQTQQVPDLRLKDMPVALPDPESRKYEPYYDFALTEAQAERWNNLHKQLATIRAEMKSRSTRVDKFLKLRKQANRLTDEINSFTAELGNPSAFEIEQALTEIERRKKLQNLLKQYDNHMRRDIKGLKWVTEHQKLLDKIADLGGADSLDDSNLRFAAPTLGRLEQKRAEVAQREKERQEQKHDVFVMPMREQPEQLEEPQMPEPEHKKQNNDMTPKPLDFEHQKTDFENRHSRDRFFDQDDPFTAQTGFVQKALNKAKDMTYVDPEHHIPDALVRLGKQGDLTSKPFMKIRGVPVKLFDLTGNNTPITQNENRAMVVVDIDGLPLPFFLANGNEGIDKIEPGKWYPLFDVTRDGSWRFHKTAEYFNPSGIKQPNGLPVEEISDISNALNSFVGDIRNYTDKAATYRHQQKGLDGFIGGVDAIDQVDPNMVADIVNYQSSTANAYLDAHIYWQGDKVVGAYAPYINWYLEHVKSHDYGGKTWEDDISEPRPEHSEKRSDNVPHTGVENVSTKQEQPIPEPVQKRVEMPKPVESVAEKNGLGTVLKTAIYKNEHDIDGEHEIPASLIKLVQQPDIISTPITTIRGVPVKLVDITGHNNPFTQNENRAMVIVDVNGQRIPFYLANGNEHGGVTGVAGVWRPVLILDHTGRWYINSNDYANSEELDTIIDALNEHIGDIRNYRDNMATQTRIEMTGDDESFVGGVDAIEHVDPNKILDIIKAGRAADNDETIWWPYGGGTSWRALPSAVARFLREVESPDYDYPKGWERIKNTMGEFRNGVGEIRDKLRWPFRRHRDKKYE